MFNAPDSAAGKRAKCPTCGGVIQIPTRHVEEEIFEAEPELASGFADEEFEVEAPASLPEAPNLKPCPMCGEMIQKDAVKCRYCGELFDKSLAGVVGGAGDVSDPRWRKVRSGLAILYYSIIIIFAAMLLLVIGAATIGAMAHNQPGGDPPVVLMILILPVGLIVLGAGIGTLVGQALCTSVPESSGARGFAIGAILCIVANFLLSMFGGIIQSEAISGMGSLVSIIGSVLFILFIRRTATYLNNQELAASAGRFLIFAAAMVGVAVVLGTAAAIAAAPAIIGIVGLVVVVGALIAFVWYLRLIKSLMTTIDQRLGAR
jgi:predicted RNA-binding Zn-ribbon protein involved in translation (DUF1610 family)